MKYLVHYQSGKRYDWGWADSLDALKDMIKFIKQRETNVVFHGIYQIEAYSDIMYNSDGELSKEYLPDDTK